MRVAGIIAEYNPFHNGHAYHMQQAREATGADFVVVVLSGPFTQRGEPSVLDKWARTRMALASGADLVLELPFAFATQSAEWFARAGVSILDATRTVTDVCFGMEADSLDPLKSIACAAAKESASFKKSLKQSLKKGLSFPAARADALSESLADGDLKKIVRQPNNILAVEYLKSLLLLESGMNPVGVLREGAGYHAESAAGEYASASYLRQRIREENWDAVIPYMPDPAYRILRESADAGMGPVSPSAYDTAVLAILRRLKPEKIAKWPDVSEGLENRLHRLAQEAVSVDALCEAAATRRYTLARIRRILAYGLTGLTQKTLDGYKKAGGPGYLRVLGFHRDAVSLIKAIRENASLPLVMSPAKALKELKKTARSQLLLDIRAQSLYELGMPAPEKRAGNRDYYRPYILPS